jgi:hypothetical protein
MDSGTFSSAGVADVTNPQTASDRDKYVLLFPAVRDLRYLYTVVLAMHVPCVADGSSLPLNLICAFIILPVARTFYSTVNSS